MYFLATEITNRELAVMRCSRAACPSATNDSILARCLGIAVLGGPSLGRKLAALDALGQVYFFLGREQRNAADLFEVQPHRVIGLDGGQSPLVQLVGQFFFFCLGGLFFRPLANLDAILHQHPKDFVEAVHIVLRLWEGEHDFFERDVSTLATGSQELLFRHRLFDDNCIRHWCCQNLSLFHR